jgi:hypothetical protein
VGAGAEAVNGFPAARQRIGGPIRSLLIALIVLAAVAATFAAGIGIYAAAPKWQPLLLAWWPGLLPGAVTIVALGAWWLWWRLPKRQFARLRHAIRDPKARADVEDNFRKTIGQLLGGAAVLLGAVLAYLQFSQQQQTSHQQFSQQQQASRELLISNQVSKGFEQLGSERAVVRLGGIFALEGVMNTSEQYHLPVLEALCAFVRDSTRTDTGGGPPATDVQAALTVIGRRAMIGAGTPDLSNARIPKANLFGAWLSNGNLRGADLRGADLSAAKLSIADLSGADLRGADLSGADLFGTTISQRQLDSACGTNAEGLHPDRTLKPCSK